MSHDGYHTVLVLGGIRSGKSDFAEGLVAGAPSVRYVATADPTGEFDDEWAERVSRHQARRPAHWTTEEIGAEPERLATVIATATPGETLLVDDLGGWLTAVLAAAAGPLEAGWSAQAAQAPVAALATAVADCGARLVIVSPEVGLTLVPATVPGRAFTDAIGTANRALGAVVDAVVLVVAGQPTWLKGRPATESAAAEPSEAEGAALPRSAGTAVAAVPAATVRAGSPAAPAGLPAPDAGLRPLVEVVNMGSGTELTPGPDEPEINSRMMLPLPDDTAAAVATDRLHNLDVPGAGLGNLAKVVGFVAGAQGTGTPAPYQAPRLMLVHGAHEGGVAAGEPAELWQGEVDRATAGAGALGLLATTAGIPIQVVDVTAEPAAPIEDGDATDPERIEIGLRQGWRLAEGAVDRGTDLIILAAAGAGQVAAAAAVVAAMVAVEPAAVLPRVVRAGRIDDQAWMARCLAVRDALRRARGRLQGSKEVLVALGGYDLAVATGIVLGATFRRTAVMIDGPVGVAAGMLARDLAAQSRLWLLLADDGGQPTVAPAAKVLGTSPLVDLRLDLGEGAAALAAFPLVQNALRLATRLAGAESQADGAASAASTGAAETGEPDGATDAGETAGAGPADQQAADTLAQSSPA